LLQLEARNNSLGFIFTTRRNNSHFEQCAAESIWVLTHFYFAVTMTGKNCAYLVH